MLDALWLADNGLANSADFLTALEAVLAVLPLSAWACSCGSRPRAGELVPERALASLSPAASGRVRQGSGGPRVGSAPPPSWF